MQKVTNSQQNLEKKYFFKFAPKRWSSVFCQIPLDQRLSVNLKICFLLNFTSNLLLFCHFLAKNAENDLFDQRLECTASKR